MSTGVPSSKYGMSSTARTETATFVAPASKLIACLYFSKLGHLTCAADHGLERAFTVEYLHVHPRGDPCGSVRDASFTSRAFSPKIARSKSLFRSKLRFTLRGDLSH